MTDVLSTTSSKAEFKLCVRVVRFTTFVGSNNQEPTILVGSACVSARTFRAVVVLVQLPVFGLLLPSDQVVRLVSIW